MEHKQHILAVLNASVGVQVRVYCVRETRIEAELEKVSETKFRVKTGKLKDVYFEFEAEQVFHFSLSPGHVGLCIRPNSVKE